MVRLWLDHIRSVHSASFYHTQMLVLLLMSNCMCLLWYLILVCNEHIYSILEFQERLAIRGWKTPNTFFSGSLLDVKRELRFFNLPWTVGNTFEYLYVEVQLQMWQFGGNIFIKTTGHACRQPFNQSTRFVMRCVTSHLHMAAGLSKYYTDSECRDIHSKNWQNGLCEIM